MNWIVCLAAAMVLWSAAVGAEQPTASGAVHGSVSDEQERVVPDAPVEISGPSMPSGRRTTSDATGSFRFLDLAPGEYTVSTSKSGFAATKMRVVVRAGLTAAVNLVLRVSPIDVEVNLTVNEPLLDSTSATQAINISGDLQGRLPLAARRDWADFLLITPGIAFNDGGLYHNHGSEFDSHVIQLDGVDLTATGSNINWGIRLNTDLLEDVQVKTAGIDAGAPLGHGAVITMASRSGTDTFRGVQSVTFRPQRWNDNNNPGGTTSASRLMQLDLSLGGPLQRGRWFFFAAHRYFDERRQVSRTTEQIALLRALSPDFEPFTHDTSAQIPFVKVTGELAPGHRVFGFHQNDRTAAQGGRPEDAQLLSDSLSGGRVNAVGISSVWRSVLTRAVVSFNGKGQGGRALGSGPVQVVHRASFPAFGVIAGTGPVAFLGNQDGGFEDRSNTWTASVDSTYFRDGWHGTHEIGGGLRIQRRHHDVLFQASNDGFVQEQSVLRDPANPGAGVIPFSRLRYSPATWNTNLNREHDVAFYLRDDWNIGPRLTLDLGVRGDVIRRFDRLFNVRTQQSTEIGPRVGFNYGLSDDGRRAVRGSWGRVHDALSTNAVRVGEDSAGSRFEYDVDLDGTFETVLDFPRITRLNDRLVIDPNRSQPYVDEWTIGYGHRFPWQVSMDVSLIERAYKNRTAFVESNGIYEGSRFVGYRNADVNEIYELTGNRWNWPVYRAIEFRVTRQAGTAQLIGGYTRGFQHMAGTWQPRDAASFIQPDAFPNDAGIGPVSGGRSPGTTNSLNGISDVRAPQWRRHLARAGATWQAPWKLLVAATYSFQSGVWSGPVVTRLDAPDPQFGPSFVDLANGRRVQNPLATPIRFAYPSRGDGQFMLPGRHIWNVRLGREVSIPRTRTRLEVTVDVFNVLNLDRNQLFLFGANQTYNQDFAKGTNRQLPRSAQLTVRASF